ncbi:MAG: GNAT family N-acetyltransferase [Myxococcales bacterium]|nr:GNAT family N-acetyltransferase [Myxococcales bacterium]
MDRRRERGEVIARDLMAADQAGELSVAELLEDVYYRADYQALHAAPDALELATGDGGFCHGAALRPLPLDAGGAPGWHDLETPYGYGGPIAHDLAALERGLERWCERQRDMRHVAELIRFHPLIDARALAARLDFFARDRETVIVDLGVSAEARRAAYHPSARRHLARARRALEVRPLRADERDAERLAAMHHAMLGRQRADARHWAPTSYYASLLGAPWSDAWAATLDGEVIAAMCFISSTARIAHYHLGGGDKRGRAHAAHYLLLDHAFEHYAARGASWMHLGGGRGAALDDSLLRFKRRFSPRAASYYVGGIVHDPQRYRALGGAQHGWFLGYRRGVGRDSQQDAR